MIVHQLRLLQELEEIGDGDEQGARQDDKGGQRQGEGAFHAMGNPFRLCEHLQSTAMAPMGP